MTTLATATLLSATAIVNASGRAVLCGTPVQQSVDYDGVTAAVLGTLPVTSVENVDNSVTIAGTVLVNATDVIAGHVVVIRKGSVTGDAVAQFPLTFNEATADDTFYVPLFAFIDPGDVGGAVYVVTIEPS